MPYGNPPSREIAAVATLLRKDSKTNRASSFGGVYPRLKRQSINLSVGYYFTEPLGDYRGGENFNEVRHYIRHYAFKQNNA